MSHLKIQHRTEGHVVIVDLDGKLTTGEGAVTLRDCVRALLTDGRKDILINLEHVAYVDSWGLGELVGAFAAAKRQGATLKLVNLTPRVVGFLRITKLLTVLETFATERDAVRSFDASFIASASR